MCNCNSIKRKGKFTSLSNEWEVLSHNEWEWETETVTKYRFIKFNNDFVIHNKLDYKNIYTDLCFSTLCINKKEKIKSSQDAEVLDILTNLRGPFVPQGWKNNLLLHPPASRPQ